MLSAVVLHGYRASSTEHLHADVDFKLTADEATALANRLLAVAAEIRGGGRE